MSESRKCECGDCDNQAAFQIESLVQPCDFCETCNAAVRIRRLDAVDGAWFYLCGCEECRTAYERQVESLGGQV